jgi:hypothetical protein
MEHGAWSMEHGAWSMEHGAWSMEHGAWSMEHGVEILKVELKNRNPKFQIAKSSSFSLFQSAIYNLKSRMTR